MAPATLSGRQPATNHQITVKSPNTYYPENPS